MLKMFCMAGEHKYDKTEDQLAAFLQRLVADEKLQCEGASIDDEGFYPFITFRFSLLSLPEVPNRRGVLRT